MVVTTLDESPQQESSSLIAFETAQSNESLRTGAKTPNKSKDQTTSALNIPIPSISEATQAEESSDTSATVAEAFVTHHTPKPNTPVLTACEVVQAKTDNDKLSAASSVPEHQSTSNVRGRAARGVTAPEVGESSRAGAQMAEAAAD